MLFGAISSMLILWKICLEEESKLVYKKRNKKPTPEWGEPEWYYWGGNAVEESCVYVYQRNSFTFLGLTVTWEWIEHARDGEVVLVMPGNRSFGISTVQLWPALPAYPNNRLIDV